MGYFLPNGTHINTDSLEAIEELHRKVMAREPIIVRSEKDGVIEEHVLWHPDDPVVNFDVPKSYVPEPGLVKRWWRRLLGRT